MAGLGLRSSYSGYAAAPFVADSRLSHPQRGCESRARAMMVRCSTGAFVRR